MEIRIFFFFSSRRRHTRCYRDWSSDVCSSDLEGCADLPYLGGSQVHSDPVHGELEASVADGRADAVAALAYRGIGKTDGGEGGQARRDVDLHEDVVGLHAEDGGRPHARQHEASVGTKRGTVNASDRIQ